MKTIHSSIVTVLAVFTLAILNTAQAQPGRFGRLRSSEKADLADSKISGLPRHDSATAASKNVAVQPLNDPKHRRYRLIDLGTLGGPNAGVWGYSVTLNNRGEVIAMSGTAVPDPYDPNCLQDDCFVWHGVVREINGVVTDLGALPGVNHSIPTWITETGLIAGLSENGLIDPLTGFPQIRAVLWNQNRSIVNLGTFGGNSSQAFGANSRSQVAGVALNAIEENPDFAQVMTGLPAATQARAFLWHNGSMQDLGTLGGNDASAAVVNEKGQVAGYSFTNTTPNDTTGIPTVHPFLWKNGMMRDLGSLGGTLSVPGSFNLAPGGQVLNDSGNVAGTSMLAGDEVWHAFVWSNGTMIDLGTLGGSTSDAVAINNKGQVIGRAKVTDTPFVRHAFVWEKGEMTDLGAVTPCTRSTAISINSAGQIVGDLGSCTNDPNDIAFFSAFIVEKGRPMVDLNTLITPPSDIHLVDAWFINDRGEIVAVGLLPDGSTRAVLLVPIPGR